MLLVASDGTFADHDPGPGHPERPARLRAVLEGVEEVACAGVVRPLEARDATEAELRRVHTAGHLERLQALIGSGGGPIDPDTVVSGGSWSAAVRAAGAGLAAVEALEEGDGTAAFCALRPPGHHATANRAMGFCLLNNVAVAAAALAERGERVVVVDWDAHHGNGTQDIFYEDPRVLYVSFHEWPLYPGTGRLHETGAGAGAGTTCNLPLPAGATGDVYLRAMDEVVGPLAERFAPTWVLVSAGYDAHRADPLTGLGLSAGDFADLTARVASLAPGPGRLVAFLEGGYDLDALRDSVVATLATLAGEGGGRAEPPTAGGPGQPVVDAAADLWSRDGDGLPQEAGRDRR
ncbi:MAG: histone deacetylase [Acidimicrobiia bacterium]|nr:histone deacetylase [Acidimicrobiia bacterium]